MIDIRGRVVSYRDEIGPIRIMRMVRLYVYYYVTLEDERDAMVDERSGT